MPDLFHCRQLNSIEAEWLNFSALIFANMNPAPEAVQVKETRQAFFAGYYAALVAMQIVGTPQVSEDQGVKFFEEREQEGAEFFRELTRRYAEGN